MADAKQFILHASEIGQREQSFSHPWNPKSPLMGVQLSRAHAEVRIGDAPIMLADEHPEMNFRSPQSIGGTPVNIVVYVNDVDALVKQAEAAGAKVLRPPADQFYGDRMATLEDPFGHSWSFATHIEDISPEEMQKRALLAGT